MINVCNFVIALMMNYDFTERRKDRFEREGVEKHVKQVLLSLSLSLSFSLSLSLSVIS